MNNVQIFKQNALSNKEIEPYYFLSLISSIVERHGVIIRREKVELNFNLKHGWENLT